MSYLRYFTVGKLFFFNLWVFHNGNGNFEYLGYAMVISLFF